MMPPNQSDASSDVPAGLISVDADIDVDIGADVNVDMDEILFDPEDATAATAATAATSSSFPKHDHEDSDEDEYAPLRKPLHADMQMHMQPADEQPDGIRKVWIVVLLIKLWQLLRPCCITICQLFMSKVWHTDTVQAKVNYVVRNYRTLKFNLEQSQQTGPSMIRLYACSSTFSSTITRPFQQLRESPRVQQAFQAIIQATLKIQYAIIAIVQSSQVKRLKQNLQLAITPCCNTLLHSTLASRCLQCYNAAAHKANQFMASSMNKLQQWQQTQDPHSLQFKAVSLLQFAIVQISLVWRNTGRPIRYILYAILIWLLFFRGNRHTNNHFDGAQDLFANPVDAYQNESRKIVMIHVGRTGGSTIRANQKSYCSFLENTSDKAHCRKYDRAIHPETTFSMQSVGLVDSDMPVFEVNSKHRIVTSYLWTLRNPIDRVMSWFDYMHPSNCPNEFNSTDIPPACKSKNAKQGFLFDFFSHCFQNIDDLGDALESPSFQGVHASMTTATTVFTCSELARNALQGTGPKAETKHLKFRYTYFADRMNYTKRVERYDPITTTDILDHPGYVRYYTGPEITMKTEYPPLEVLAVNQEYLERDLRYLEMYLKLNKRAVLPPIGIPNLPTRSMDNKKNGPTMVKFNETHGSEHFKMQSRNTVSSRTTKAICCWVQDDVAMYVHILRHAVNLHKDERSELMGLLASRCGGYWNEPCK